MAYETVESHRRMALDSVRNAAYFAALQRVITPDSVVLDLGAGTGVLGMMAARLGAKRVYLVEPSDVITVAEEIAAANGLGEVVRILHGKLADVVIPEKVDVIVSVMTGNFLLTEDLLPVLFHARDTLLKPNGHLIPDMAVMAAVPVAAPRVHATHVASWSAPHHGIDLSAARGYAANSILYGPTGLADATFLADPADLLSLDFTSATYEPLHARVVFDATTSGTCDGLAGWFRMKLGDTWLSTSPASPQTHWSGAFLPIEPPVMVEKGDRLSLALDRLPEGDWSWRLTGPAGARRHSTLLGAPLMPATLKKAAHDYVPPRTDDVNVTEFVLSCIDGTLGVATIAARLQATFPQRFTTLEAALAFTQQLVNRF